MDMLRIEGVSRRVDGEYPCDIRELLDPSSDESLTIAEWYSVQRLSEIRPNEALEAFVYGDVRLRVALAVVIVARDGGKVDADAFQGKRPAAIRYELEQRGESETEGDEGDPPTTEGETPSRSGGRSSGQISENQDVAQSPTGQPPSGTATEDQVLRLATSAG